MLFYFQFFVCCLQAVAAVASVASVRVVGGAVASVVGGKCKSSGWQV